MSSASEFNVRYGPWAVVTGASDGTGAAFAQQLAERGINLVLVARREGPLEELAARLRKQFGVETRTASVDLYQSSAADEVIAVADGLEVGLLVANAGSDPNGSPFLDASYDAWQDMLTRNVLTVARTTYHFAAPMRARKRGGIIVLSSGAALSGQHGGAIYSGTKSFQLNFCESLWSELRRSNVDVLCCVCAAMNTPSLRKLLDEHGLDPVPMAEPDDVVAEFLSVLGTKPVIISPYMGNDAQVARMEKERYERLLYVEELSKKFYG